ncbi:MAG: DedA family protein [Armatimonadetes bacterium]|nr:DedA family protein [Armatimonadota bacterium]
MMIARAASRGAIGSVRVGSQGLEHISDLIAQYGYWAILIGVMAEGDLTLVVAGMLAHERLLNFGFSVAFAFAMLGAVLGDVCAFTVGRCLRSSMLQTEFYKKFHPRMEWLDMRFGAFSIVLVKYIYGLRFASSIFWGMSRMTFGRFMVLTLFSCLVWVGMLTGLGLIFGTAISHLFDRFNAVAVTAVGAVIGAGLLYAVHHWWLSPVLQHEAEKAGLTDELDPNDPRLVALKLEEPPAVPAPPSQETHLAGR